MKRFLAGALMACALAAQAAETRAAESAGSLLQTLVGLIVVLAVLAGAAWAMKRFGINKALAGTTVKIIGGVSVGNRERILVVEVADQWIVVGVAPGRVNTLATMPRQEAPAAPIAPPGGNNFAAWLKQTIDKRHGNQS